MYERMQRLLDALSTDLHERDEAVRLGVLAAVAGESMFLLGPPGTGKSLIARRLQQAFRGARAFSYLMGRFSTPDEVFGPLSIRALRQEDRFERRLEGYLPDADVVFLDEIWKASPPIQNALLTALNERRFRNGAEELRIPLKVFIGASNELPEPDDEAAAFWDRFLVRLVVEPIRDREAFAALLSETADPYRSVVDDRMRISGEEFDQLREQEALVRIPPQVVSLITAIRDALADTADPVYVSDRRWKKIASLLRASAVMHDREEVEPIDCAIIKACAWSTVEERPRVAGVVSRELAAGSGRSEIADRFAGMLDAIRGPFENLQFEVVVSDQPQPVTYRDEYYRLVPAGAQETADGTPAEDELMLVWRGDVEELRRHEDAVVDLFRYDAEGQLRGSQEVRVRPDGGWQITVDGVAFRIETSRERVTSHEPRTLEESERAALLVRIDALEAELDGTIAELSAERDRLEDSGVRHLFVPVADAAIVVEAIGRTIARLAELGVLADELSARVSAS